jgi:hypothetical protein
VDRVEQGWGGLQQPESGLPVDLPDVAAQQRLHLGVEVVDLGRLAHLRSQHERTAASRAASTASLTPLSGEKRPRNSTHSPSPAPTGNRSGSKPWWITEIGTLLREA